MAHDAHEHPLLAQVLRCSGSATLPARKSTALPSTGLPMNVPMIGIGLYTVAEAAAYTGIPARDISRWLFGYTVGAIGSKQYRSGLWRPQLADIAETKALGFLDLLEIRFVHAFRQRGVSLQAIRSASQHASELFRSDYPFLCKRFQTDGRSIFATVLEETHDETLLDLVKKQYVFKQVISSSLYEGIEYDGEGGAERWFPLLRNRVVVLDPKRNFGKPIVTESGVSTATLVDAFLAEGKNAKRVANLFEVSVAAVEAAIRFEHREAA